MPSTTQKEAWTSHEGRWFLTHGLKLAKQLVDEEGAS